MLEELPLSPQQVKDEAESFEAQKSIEILPVALVYLESWIVPQPIFIC